MAKSKKTGTGLQDRYDGFEASTAEDHHEHRKPVFSAEGAAAFVSPGKPIVLTRVLPVARLAATMRNRNADPACASAWTARCQRLIFESRHDAEHGSGLD